MKLKQNAGWGIKLGYSYALDNEKTYNGGLSSKDFDLTRFIYMKGPGLEIYISGVSQKGNINTIALHYNHLSSGTYIYSHGYSGGPVSIEYAKYTEEYSIIGLKYTFMKRVEDSFFFIAFGIEGRDITRTYSEEGSVDYISPSNRIEKLFKLPLTHEFGLILVFPK